MPGSNHVTWSDPSKNRFFYRVYAKKKFKKITPPIFKSCFSEKSVQSYPLLRYLFQCPVAKGPDAFGGEYQYLVLVRNTVALPERWNNFQFTRIPAIVVPNRRVALCSRVVCFAIFLFFLKSIGSFASFCTLQKDDINFCLFWPQKACFFSWLEII